MIRLIAAPDGVPRRAVAVAVVIAGILLIRHDIASESIWLSAGLALVGLVAPLILLLTPAARRSLAKPFRRALLVIFCLNLFPVLIILEAVRQFRERSFGRFDDYVLSVIGWGGFSLALSASVVAIGRCFQPDSGNYGG